MSDSVQFRLVVGLGNPGDRYRGTRHNVGFEVVDELARRQQVAVGKRQSRALLGEYRFGEARVILVKPQTFMNLSGEAVAAVAHMLRVEPRHTIVVSDDVALPVGKVRLRLQGSAGGHNGLKSVSQHLGSQGYPRVRIGVGGGGMQELTDHVLGRYTAAERLLVNDAVLLAADAVEMALRDGFEIAMNRFNGIPKS